MDKKLRPRLWIATIGLTLILMRRAYLERGYFACGGEVLVLLVPFIVEIIASLKGGKE